MKSKLDLNTLLAKYQGNSNSRLVHQYDKYDKPIQDSHIEQQFYEYDKENKLDNQFHYQNQPIPHNYNGNFHMSKSECQQFLINLRQQLSNEQKSMNFCAENAMKQLHQNFNRSHQLIKREILELLERAFAENERAIREQLMKQSKIDPIEFSAVHNKLIEMDNDIGHLLSQLKGVGYRKAIADVVLRDFNAEIQDLRAAIKASKQSYILSLGRVEPDRSRIDCLKQDLRGLFYFNKKITKLVENTVIEGIFGNKKQASKEQKMRVTDPPSGKARKSFFNFISND